MISSTSRASHMGGIGGLGGVYNSGYATVSKRHGSSDPKLGKRVPPNHDENARRPSLNCLSPRIDGRCSQAPRSVRRPRLGEKYVSLPSGLTIRNSSIPITEERLQRPRFERPAKEPCCGEAKARTQPATTKPHHPEQGKAKAKINFPMPGLKRKKTGPAATKDSGKIQRGRISSEQPRPRSSQDKTAARRSMGEKPAALRAGSEDTKAKKFKMWTAFKHLFGRNDKGHTKKGGRRASVWCPNDQSEMSSS